MSDGSSQRGSFYYEQVAAYYDQEAGLFEEHYLHNPILQRIRQDFRAMSERYPFTTALEIGCGPGIDLVYFAEKYPQRQFFGIDVSPAMVELASLKIERLSLKNVVAKVGTPETVKALFPGQRFDLIYCFFGALNTVKDLRKAARYLTQVLATNGIMVLTFVNRWYWFEIIWNMLRLRWVRAWARPLDRWRGYAPNRPLESHCRSAREINHAFSPFTRLIFRKGYSIFFPAWYRHRFIPTQGKLGDLLWKIDGLINRTPLWNIGEYSLYVFQRR